MDAKADSLIENRFFFKGACFFIAKTLAAIRVIQVRFAPVIQLMNER